MRRSKAQQEIEKVLQASDVRVNGDRPWDIQVHNPDFYARVFYRGSMGLGESYMDGWWDSPALDQFFYKILDNQLDAKVRSHSIDTFWDVLKANVSNLQNRSRAYLIGKKHYDIGNDLFALMLDQRLNYSCGYWKNAATLDQAQEQKLDLICRKMNLKPGMSVLDIGCGWGGFSKYAAQQYGVRVRGITVSGEQARFATQSCQGLDVSVDLMDYRDLNEEFDRVVSIGMFEHVGSKNYRTYMQVVQRCLRPGGLFLLHTIATNSTLKVVDPWIRKYIFPNSMLPSARHIVTASDGIFVVEDWHSIGQHYDPTLMAWYKNFSAAWPKLKDHYGDRFYRMWCYYLLACAGSFRARSNQVWQIVFSEKGILDGLQYRT